jgi:hypothetical protein
MVDMSILGCIYEPIYTWMMGPALFGFDAFLSVELGLPPHPQHGIDIEIPSSRDDWIFLEGRYQIHTPLG